MGLLKCYYLTRTSVLGKLGIHAIIIIMTAPVWKVKRICIVNHYVRNSKGYEADQSYR